MTETPSRITNARRKEDVSVNTCGSAIEPMVTGGRRLDRVGVRRGF